MLLWYAPVNGICDRHVEDPVCPVAGGLAARHRLKFTRLWRGWLPSAGLAACGMGARVQRCESRFQAGLCSHAMA